MDKRGILAIEITCWWMMGFTSTGLRMIRECSKSGVTGKSLKTNIPQTILSSNNIPKVANHVNYLFHRSSACERPRTYDKFYRKGPSNFQGAAGEKGHMQQDHAKTHCSSDEEDIPKVTSGGSQRNKRKKISAHITEIPPTWTKFPADLRNPFHIWFFNLWGSGPGPQPSQRKGSPGYTPPKSYLIWS